MEEIIKENQEENAKTIQAEIEQAMSMPEDVPTTGDTAPAIGAILTPEQFEEKFFELFDIAGDITDIQELKINREKSFEVSGAKATAKRLYVCAEKYKALHFLIENGGGWLADAILIGGFCYGKANVVVYHYSGKTLGNRLFARFKKAPAGMTEKASVISRFFKKEAENESEVKA